VTCSRFSPSSRLTGLKKASRSRARCAIPQIQAEMFGASRGEEWSRSRIPQPDPGSSDRAHSCQLRLTNPRADSVWLRPDRSKSRVHLRRREVSRFAATLNRAVVVISLIRPGIARSSLVRVHLVSEDSPSIASCARIFAVMLNAAGVVGHITEA